MFVAIVNPDVLQLRRAFLNEKLAPMLLPYEHEVLEGDEGLKALVEQQAGHLDNPAQSLNQQIDLNLYQLEVDRVQYLIAAYLRTRLLKLQAHPFWYLFDHSAFGLLCPSEQHYVRRYVALLENHFGRCVLNEIPKRWRRLDAKGAGADNMHVQNAAV